MSKKQKVKDALLPGRTLRERKSAEDAERNVSSRLQKQASIRRFRGKIKWEGDLEQSRASGLG